MKDLLQKKRRLVILCLVAGILVLALGVGLGMAAVGEGYTLTTYAMGSFVQQTVYGGNREEAASAASTAVVELEDLISRNVADSDIIRLNQAAGTEFLEIDQRSWDVLNTSLQVCQASDGAFDVTIGPISGLWGFDTEEPHRPQDSTIQSLLPMVDYKNLSLLEDGTAALQIHGAALDLGAVGKGAGCDAAVAAYQENGVDRAIVSVGGSVGVYGKKPWDQPWRIAVRNPDTQGSLGELAIYEGFLSTSGSYEKYFTQDGVTYHHILDPRTGYPAESGLLSVTVWSSGGALSDALSTACFVLGMEDSLPLLEEFDCGGIFITEDHQIYVTENLQDAFTLEAEGYTLAGVV
ncbi:MAG: FAD:protein FMN transferase [Acutalibacter sp.]|jgi:thiamine biosynthesis lipoprotein